jgi:hypothetical protein
MAVTAGASPWSPEYKRSARRAKDYRAVGLSDEKQRYGMTYGWRRNENQRPSDQYVTITSHISKKVHRVPRSDYDDFSRFYRPLDENGNLQRIDEALMISVEKAFSGKSPVWTINVDPNALNGITKRGVGGVKNTTPHIKRIRYNAGARYMIIDYTKGDSVVLYLQVPPVVFSELWHFASPTGPRTATATRTAQSYVDKAYHTELGMKYWDIIRERHTGGKGVRYAFNYLSEGTQTTSNDVQIKAPSDVQRIDPVSAEVQTKNTVVADKGVESPRSQLAEVMNTALAKAKAFGGKDYLTSEINMSYEDTMKALKNNLLSEQNIKDAMAAFKTVADAVDGGDRVKLGTAISDMDNILYGDEDGKFEGILP